MSRIGRHPVAIPAGVEVTIAENNYVTVKGPKGTLEKALPVEMEIKQEGDEIVVTRPNDLKKMKSLHGLTRTLINNMVVGVTAGYEKVLEVNGVGYRAAKSGNKLTLNLGYSHPVEMEDPEGVETVVEGQNKITVKGIDKEKVGQYAAEISIFDSLALIRLRSSLVSDLSCVLANLLFADSGYDDLVAVYLCLDTFRIFHLYRMRISKVQGQLLACLSSSVTNTVYFQSLCIALAYTDRHVVDQCSGKTMERFHSLQIVRS